MAPVTANVLLVARHATTSRAHDGSPAIVIAILERHDLGGSKTEEEEVQVRVLKRKMKIRGER